MGIEAENHMAQKDAEERKPLQHEFQLARNLIDKKILRTSAARVTDDDYVAVAELLAEHRMETKRIVLEEQGIDNGQDLEKRGVLSKRCNELEAKVKELTAEKDRLARTLGYVVADKIEILAFADEEPAVSPYSAQNGGSGSAKRLP